MKYESTPTSALALGYHRQRHGAHWELERQLREHDEPVVRGHEPARMRRHLARRAER